MINHHTSKEETIEEQCARIQKKLDSKIGSNCSICGHFHWHDVGIDVCKDCQDSNKTNKTVLFDVKSAQAGERNDCD